MIRNTSLQTHPWDRALAPEACPLLLSLQWAQQRALACMQPILEQHRLSAAEFDVLATLRNAPEPFQLTPSQIQYQVVITSGDLTKILLQLSERGLVERSQDAGDLRCKPVRLTPSGRQAIESAMPAVLDESSRWLTSRLSAAEMSQLTGLLQRLLDLPPDTGKHG